MRPGGVEKDNDKYNTGSLDKEDRKKLRRDRVAKALAAQQPGRKTGPSDDAAKAGLSNGDQQVADSLSHLDKKKSTGIDAVTAVRVSADDRETQRRMSEEHGRQERLQRLQEEAVRSGKQNAAVEMRWAELLEQNMPQELHRDIEDQKSACAEIISSKDGLIADFQTQLKAKDEEYVKSLKQQADDVTELLHRMRTEFKEISEEYEVELEAIEESFLQERELQLASNKAQIDALFDKRREMELGFMESKQQRQEQYQQEIEDLLTRDGEEYNKLKVKLETDIQTLEQQLEEMRATYQLNTEKLEYNYR
jgi:dynein regulatry complex protein 1|eukprot:5579-Heterococcus_DN1.PRE.2